jgi:hypothetical protein
VEALLLLLAVVVPSSQQQPVAVVVARPRMSAVVVAAGTQPRVWEPERAAWMTWGSVGPTRGCSGIQSLTPTSRTIRVVCTRGDSEREGKKDMEMER